MAAQNESTTGIDQQTGHEDDASDKATFSPREADALDEQPIPQEQAEQPQSPGEPPSIEELMIRVDALQAQAEEAQQRLLRVQADYDNFRRRTRLEKEEFAKYASQRLIEQLLPVVDNFERALSASRANQDYEAFAKGVDMISRQLDQLLASEGLAAMQTVGEPFNPELHQAIMQVESEEFEEGAVVEEVQKGYILKDKVLRPAMVKVKA